MIDPTAVAGSSSGRPLLLLLPTKKIYDHHMVYCKNENGRWYESYCMALRVFEGLNSLPRIWQVGSCRLPMTKLLLLVEDCLTLCMGWTETKKNNNTNSWSLHVQRGIRVQLTPVKTNMEDGRCTYHVIQQYPNAVPNAWGPLLFCVPKMPICLCLSFIIYSTYCIDLYSISSCHLLWCHDLCIYIYVFFCMAWRCAINVC